MIENDLLSIVREVTTGEKNAGLLIILMMVTILILTIYTISKNSMNK